eukprot:CAMPEP_0197549546 /NCGR_PEP_ID=MMETSP1320-20131121/3421_1 /TAXON_ID=91990 /ORGANISM="Bolidomonas sp., Strain RCC2347" /LENGTH=338 /DNA_ID=CAMNT_0043109795 /DNA_START=252 /DNA_END=1268 /DNA_ORIENTATION=+
MKLAILGLLATGASASFSMRRLQDSSGPHPGECNIDSDCIDEDHPEGICVPKATHSHDHHLRRKLFGGVDYSGYCMDLVCMAGESTFYQAHAEGLFASDSNPIAVIQERGWCDDGTTDGWVAYAHSAEAGCSAEVMGQMSGYAALSCQCPGLDLTFDEESNGPPSFVCSITDDMPAICEETIKSLFLAEVVAEQGQEMADSYWDMWSGMCSCPITNWDNMFCELRDLPAECEGAYRPMIEESWGDSPITWEIASSMSICSCGTSGGYKFPEGEDAKDDDIDINGWSGQSLCGETEMCKNEAIDAWVSASAFYASMSGDTTNEVPSRSELEAHFYDVCQ